MMRLDTARGQLAKAVRAAVDAAAVRVLAARGRHRALPPARVIVRRLEYLTQAGRRLARAGRCS